MIEVDGYYRFIMVLIRWGVFGGGRGGGGVLLFIVN